jgi:hypothetical protein
MERFLAEAGNSYIGTKFAPAIFMYFLETRMLMQCEFKPCLWWRFLDDIFFIWLHGIPKGCESFFILLIKFNYKLFSRNNMLYSALFWESGVIS